jgi:hypothetical protein
LQSEMMEPLLRSGRRRTQAPVESLPMAAAMGAGVHRALGCLRSTLPGPPTAEAAELSLCR